MATDNQIGLQAIFDNQDFQSGISEYNRSVSDASSNTDSSSGTMSAAWEGMAAVGQAAFSAIAAGVSAMATELYLAVSAAIEAEDAMARVEFVVANVAERTGVTTDEVSDLATSLSKVLPIDDEVIAQAIAMGLTFDGVNQNNIEPLISAAADLAAWTGQDLPAAMKNLSLSITDPDRAMRLFKEANITLTDEQKKTLKALGDTGDTAGATAFILEQLAQKGIIGLGEAMGETAKGKFTIMQTAIGNLQESLGEGLLDALKDVFERITDFANNPKTIDFFIELGRKIGDFASLVLENVPDIITTIENVADWFVENKPLIVGILAALGVAMIAFSVVAIEAGIAAVAGLWPVILVMGLVGAAAALLFTAWTENWGGIQERVAELWAVIQPIFESLMAWMGENLPIALQFLSDLWTTVLLPAIQAVFEWLVNNIIPLWISLVQWLQINIPLAIQTLSGYWTNTLLPAIQAVWGWINTNLIPLFNAVAKLMNAVLSLAIRALAGLWQNVLLPAIQAAGGWIQTNLNPVLQAISDVVNNNVMPALGPFADFLNDVLLAAFEGITSGIQDLITWIDDLTNALLGIELPPALTPGSPTPFEMGLRGINAQLKELANLNLPAVTHEMNMLGSSRDVSSANGAAASNSLTNNSQVTRNYLFGAKFSVSNSNGLLDILNGLK